MSNHYHLLIWTPNSDIDKFMFEYNRNISSAIRLKTNRINRIFGDRYKWSLVEDDFYLFKVLKYIYRIPVKAKIVSRFEDYPYSTLHHLWKNNSLPFSLFNPILGNQENFIKEINEQESSLEEDKLKLALTRPIFRIPSDKTLSRNSII